MARDLRGLVEQLTLEEKAQLCSGASFWTTQSIERLEIPSIMMSDGPHGLRAQPGHADHMGIYESIPSTCFPSAVGMASSWNRDLVRKIGGALGKEAQAVGVAVLLGPGANIKRSPLCGRNFEYFSEDPFLTGEMATAHIEGVQSQGIGTSIKHFAANNQEHRRMTTNVIVDERTLREIYLTGFEIAVKKSQPWTVMAAYNRLNGTYCADNETLLTRILKEEWGHDGIVVSDWGAVDEAAASVAAGLELEMPSNNGIGAGKIIAAVQSGELSVEKLNQSVERLLSVVFKAFENKKENATYDKLKHHELAREAAREMMVLLKNDDQMLPLEKTARIAVIGSMAKKVRYQGGGSSHVNPTKLESILDEIELKVVNKSQVCFAPGYDLDSEEIDEQAMEEAKQAAKQAELAIVFVGLPERYESEGYDRKHLNIPNNQSILIEQIASVQPNIVVVLSNGAPVVMPWLGKVKSVLEAYLGGQALGGAVADLLFGDANPSGKLAETFPVSLKHNPSHLFFPGEGDRVEYREGLFVGYRYYDAKDIEPLFPFGHGLSYTTFEFSDLALEKTKITDQETLEVSLKLKNTGVCTGQEVVQLYVRAKASQINRPEKELKGFAKVSLEPGEETTVRLKLDKRSFAYYNTDLKDWHVESGEYELLIGASSRDIKLAETLQVQSTKEIVTTYHRNTAFGDIMDNPKAATVVAEFIKMMSSRNDSDSSTKTLDMNNVSEMMSAMMRYMAVRGLTTFAGGRFSEEKMYMFLEHINHAVKSDCE